MILKIIYFFILIELVIVGAIDIKSKKISNFWSVLHVVLSIIFYFTLYHLYPFSWEIFVFPFSFLIGGFLLFLIEVMGAGDSKYLATLFLLIPVEYHLLFLEKLILSTIVTGMIFLILKIIRSRKILGTYLIAGHWSGIKHLIKSRFSFAPVILLAWIFLGLEI